MLENMFISFYNIQSSNKVTWSIFKQDTSSNKTVLYFNKSLQQNTKILLNHKADQEVRIFQIIQAIYSNNFLSIYAAACIYNILYSILAKHLCDQPTYQQSQIANWKLLSTKEDFLIRYIHEQIEEFTLNLCYLQNSWYSSSSTCWILCQEISQCKQRLDL